MRHTSLLLLSIILTAGGQVFTQSPPPRILPTLDEPPPADPGESKPAPTETTVVPGAPRRLLPPALSGGEAAPRKVDEPGTGVEPAQFITPQPRTASPTVIYPEPPTPYVRISVRGMDTAASGQELTFQLLVSNPSEARAHNVIARCVVPRNAKLVKALPQPTAEAKDLEWHLETLEPGATRTIEVVFKPNDDVGELIVTGRVQFEHGRWVKTRIASPNLNLRKLGPAQGIINDPIAYRITITNPGKVPVEDLQLVDTLPEGLEYVQETSAATPASRVGPGPNQRSWTIGTLKPNETRQIEYRVIPRKAGDWSSEVVATGSGVQAKAGCNTAVHEARLTLQVTGPGNDKATANAPTPYTIHVHNTGTAHLHNVRISCNFPAEMRLARASSGGQIFRDAVQWIIPKLDPKETKELTVSLAAPSAGLREVQVSARADKGLEQRKKIQTVFEGIPALNWQTEGTPVASPNQEIAYTITVTNPGSAPAKNVKITVDLPDQVEFRQAQPAFQRGQNAIFFNPLEIGPKQTVALKVIGTAKKAGEARFHFELTAEGMSSGPLKNTKATTISPGGEPKKEVDPTRIGILPPLDNKPDPKGVTPATFVNPVLPPSPPAP